MLQETQRSRQMTNQITQRIFQGHPGHSCQQEVLPCGEKVTVEKYRSLGWLIKAFVVLFSTKKQQIKNKTKKQTNNVKSGLYNGEYRAWPMYVTTLPVILKSD